MPFETRTFTVHDHACGMRVGTDAFLLGLLAAERCRDRQPTSTETCPDLPSDKHVPLNVVDVGVGCGVATLVFCSSLLDWHAPSSCTNRLVHCVGIDIDPEAAAQADVNMRDAAAAHPALTTETAAVDVRSGSPLPLEGSIDVVLCNPPFHDPKRVMPEHKAGHTAINKKRRWARLRSSLDYDALIHVIDRVLRPTVATVIPCAFVVYPVDLCVEEFGLALTAHAALTGSALGIAEYISVWDNETEMALHANGGATPQSVGAVRVVFQLQRSPGASRTSVLHLSIANRPTVQRIVSAFSQSSV
jgi:tRNA1(Val) A37 N6-methylase TrmN6